MNDDLVIKNHVPGWVDGWMEVKAILRIAYSNQQLICAKKSDAGWTRG